MRKRDMLIISNLRRNARQPLINISRQTRIPVSTLYDKIKRFESTIIKKYTALVDFEKLGFNIRLLILLKIKDEEKFKQFLFKSKNVNSAFRISNGYDVILDCIFKYIKEMNNTIDQIEEFSTDKKVFYVSKVEARENFLSKLL